MQDSPCNLDRDRQRRKHFSKEDDQCIVNEVRRYKIQRREPNWGAIASKIPGKTGRQCRERYHHYLNPAISRAPWTKEEDDLIRKLHAHYGANWAQIALAFGGTRTNNNIKNRWNSHLRHISNDTVVSGDAPVPRVIIQDEKDDFEKSKFAIVNEPAEYDEWNEIIASAEETETYHP